MEDVIYWLKYKISLKGRRKGMKRKVVLRLLSLVMVASMTGTMLPSNIQTASAEEVDVTEKTAALEDGINDAWTQDNKADGDTVTVENGWLHIKSAAGNRNNPGTRPQMVVNPNTFDFNKPGYFSFTLKSNNANTGISDSDRVGVYLGYNTDQNGMYIGYDNGGWFWQKYKGGNGDYYQQTRKPAPTKDQEVKVRIDWTADHKMTFTLNGEVVFDKEDFSGIADSLGNKIAIKAGSWGQIGSDVLLKDIHYTGQEEAVTYTVTGSVTDESGKALEGAVVTTGNLTAETDKDGKYSLQLGAGKHELTITKAGYQTATTSVTVTEGNVEAKAVKTTEEPVQVAPVLKDTAKPVEVKYIPVEVTEKLQGTPFFEVVEQMPEYPGGMAAAMEYIQKNMRYPETAKKNGTQGRVTVQFIVDKEGNVTEPKVIRAVDKDLDAEAIRLVGTMPKWKPGMQKGQAVAVKYTLPVMFRLEGGEMKSSRTVEMSRRPGSLLDSALVMVDGKEVTQSILNAINVDRIMSFSVLKDAASTAIYGERGKNGVILITLKEDKEEYHPSETYTLKNTNDPVVLGVKGTGKFTTVNGVQGIYINSKKANRGDVTFCRWGEN